MTPLLENEVAVWRGDAVEYSARPPFSPFLSYPEYGLGDSSSCSNSAYDAVRGCFQLAELDASRFGTSAWNPLGDLIHEGETVLLKPNMVHERHPRDPQGWKYVITHGSVIRAVSDYVWKAIGPAGKIIVADAPQADASFKEMVRLLGLDATRDFYDRRGLRFELFDLRQEEWTARSDVIVERRKLPPNPYGSVAFDLGNDSEFEGHPGAGSYYGADYDAGVVNRHHSGGRHEYLIAGCAIRCDVVFSLPKWKTHKKAGITASLKNLVGVNADKNWLPHHTEGIPSRGGDEHPNPDLKHQAERKLAAAVRSFAHRVPVIGPWVHRIVRNVGKPVFGDTEMVIRSGNWYGNDTIWRMCLDLNKIVLYGNADGTLRAPLPQNRKRHFVLVDGILAGQGRGPLNPDPVPAGTLLFGVHPPSVDAVCAYLMGFDPDKIPVVARAFQCREFPLADHGWREIVVRSNRDPWNRRLMDITASDSLDFEPHFGWKQHIERSVAPQLSGNEFLEVARRA
ncbi:MAG TPA: DUF362 domain-containing protein [Candidatus Binatia bacterium]|nr:DUF362 domain-containing protein [Candidatus Binatia bacterium]